MPGRERHAGRRGPTSMLADFLTTSPRGAERFRPEALLFLCVAALVGAVAHLLAVRLLAPSFPVGYAASAGLALLVGTACAAHATGAVAARAAALPGMLTLAALGGYGWVVAHLWDTSPDADAYHISGILGLASGWVPSQGPFGGDMRVDHWPHGHWALETAAYALWGDVEAGKVVCLLYVLAAGGVMAAAVCVLRGRPTRLDLGLIALTVANPVVFSQLLTHYLDGVVYLLCLMLLFGLYLADTVHRRAGCWIVAATVILLINTKTAGLYYGGMLVFGYMLAHLARWRDLTHTPHGLRARAAVPALAAAAALLAIVVGTRPYVVNWVEHRAVVYPDLSRIMRGQRPANLAKAAPPTQLLYLIFGKTGGGQGEAVILKVPGTVSPSEWRGLSVGTRTGAFGPLFGAQWLLGIAAFGAALAGTPAATRWVAAVRVPAGMALWGMVVSGAFPEAWWGRYVPLVWTVPLLLLLAMPPPALARRAVLSLTLACLLAAGMNACLALGDGMVNAVLLSARSRTSVTQMAARGPVVLVPTGHNGSTAVWTHRLTAMGIAWRVVRDAPCADRVTLSPYMQACLAESDRR